MAGGRQEQAFPVGVQRRGVLEADPLRLPVAGFKQTHCPMRRLAPTPPFSGLVPHLNLPVAHGARHQPLAPVNHVDILVAGNLAGVPQVARAGGEPAGIARDQDAIRALALAAPGARHLPAQPRRALVQACRVLQILTAKPDGLERVGGGERGDNHDRDDNGSCRCDGPEIDHGASIGQHDPGIQERNSPCTVPGILAGHFQ